MGITAKMEEQEKCGPIGEWGREPGDTGDGKNNVLGAFFALVFTGKTCSQESKARETHGKVQRKEDLPQWTRIRLGSI